MPSAMARASSVLAERPAPITLTKGGYADLGIQLIMLSPRLCRMAEESFEFLRLCHEEERQNHRRTSGALRGDTRQRVPAVH